MKFGIYRSIADPPAGANLALKVEEVVAEDVRVERRVLPPENREV